MFDIGFWELTVIAVVALIVIGPERLPKVARTVGLWVGRMRGMVLSVKADIDRELRAEELKRMMEEQARSAGLHEIIEETRETLDELEKPDYLVKAEKPAALQGEEFAGDNKKNQDNGEKS
jgi:sec-independent protein translocase protein TatB